MKIRCSLYKLDLIHICEDLEKSGIIASKKITNHESEFTGLKDTSEFVRISKL